MTEPHELIQSIIDAKPVEFDKQFASLVQDRVTNLVADKKIEIAQTFFSPPEEEAADDEVTDEPSEEEGDDTEGDTTSPEEETEE